MRQLRGWETVQMQRINKSLNIFIIFTIIFLFSVTARAVTAPVSSSPPPAANSSKTSTSKTPPSTKTTVKISCSNLNEALDAMVSDIKNRQSNLDKVRKEADEKNEKRRNEDAEKRQKNREAKDRELQEIFDGLGLIIKDESYKKALENYVSEMKAAIQANREALDSARDDYIGELDKAMAIRRTAVDNAVSALANDYARTIVEAKSACLTATTSEAKKSAIAGFQANKKKDVARYNTARKKAVDDFNRKDNELKKVRDKKIADANKALKQAIEEAKNNFLAALSKKVEKSDNS